MAAISPNLLLFIIPTHRRLGENNVRPFGLYTVPTQLVPHISADVLEIAYSPFKPLPGPLWRKHRKLANPNYGKRAIDSYGDVFNSETRLLLEKCRAVPAGQQFNVYRFVVQATSYSVCRECQPSSFHQ